MRDDAADPNPFLLVLARLLLASPLLVSGVGKIIGYDGTVEFAAANQVPYPEIAVVLATVAELALPLLIVLGLATRWAAIALILFVLATNYFFHQFWDMEGEGRTLNKLMFFKNLAIIGGLLLLAQLGPGRWALGGKRRSRR